jgi:D-arabinose 1-dehydrogenase-like Zn-dependent alcohol dehydrogenase
MCGPTRSDPRRQEWCGEQYSVVHFAQLTGVRPMIETYPLEKAGEAYARMMSGNAQFRVVLTM